MKKSTEMRQKLDEIKNQIETLKDAGKIDEAHSRLEALNLMKKEIAVQEAIEQEEFENAKEQKTEVKTSMRNMTQIFNRLIRGEEITAEERKAYYDAVGTPGQAEHTPDKGGYLVPEEQLNKYRELKRKYVSLKDYCNVVPVSSMSGKYPVEVESNGLLTNFEELNEITPSDITFAQVTFNIKDYGDLIPVSNTLLADEKVGIFDIIGKSFAKKSVNTENAEVLTALKTATKTDGADFRAIKTALNTKIPAAIRANAVIITNQSGFEYLDQCTDRNGRPLLQPFPADETKHAIHGKEIVILDDAVLEGSAGTKNPYFIGDVSEFIDFNDRQAVTVEISSHAGFKQNANLVRAIERFDVNKVDIKAVAYVEIPKSAPTEIPAPPAA